MYLLPQPCKFLKVLSRDGQDFLHVRPFGIPRLNGIAPFRQSDTAIGPEIDNRLRLASKTVNMARQMIVREGDE
jgi:hypothetical protein